MADANKNRWVELLSGPLDMGAAFRFLQTPRAGGIAIFAGTTRQWTQGRETLRLEYEGYEPMALKVMHKLLDEAEEQWPVLRACLLHRLGEVPIADASVIVGTSTPHRADAFEAARFLIDRLKLQVPIWKREYWADGNAQWITGPSPPEASGE